MTAMPILAEQAEKWGLVNHVVEGNELLKKARQLALAIIKNNQDLVLRYKAVINDGFKQDLAHALALEKVILYLSPSAHVYRFVVLSLLLTCVLGNLASYSSYLFHGKHTFGWRIQQFVQLSNSQNHR